MATFDLNTFWLKINYFKLTHVEDLRKWWAIVLVAADVFVLVFCVTNIILYVIDIPRQRHVMQAMAADAVNYQSIREANTPSPLQTVSTAAIPVGNGTYDLVARVKNANTTWAGAVLSYTFTLNGQKTAAISDFILPDTEKYLVALGIKGVSSGSGQVSATFAVDGVQWHRWPDKTLLQRTQFITNAIDFSVSAVVDKSLVQQVTAQVSNTGYTSFWQARFTVVCWQGGTIVGVGSTRFDQFRSGDTKSLHVAVNVSSAPSRVEILPDVNILDADNLIQ